MAGSLSLRIQQLDVRCETKTKDNVWAPWSCSFPFAHAWQPCLCLVKQFTHPFENVCLICCRCS